MKTMTCKQLVSPCDVQFHAVSFEEIAAQSRKHGMEMFHQGDEAHLKAMNGMKSIMSNPDRMKEWFESTKKEFESIPEN